MNGMLKTKTSFAASPALPMTYAQLLKQTSAGLQKAGITNSEQEALWIVASLSKLSKSRLTADVGQPALASLTRRVEEVVARRQTGEPLAYILGETEFFGLKLKVSPAVLIPRPETETLVEKTLEQLIFRKSRVYPFAILDIGTGSGCIALALLSELPQAQAVATDISKEALLMAAENARRLGLENRLSLVLGNLLEPFPSGELFDLIISNPPYLGKEEMLTLDRSVREFEPGIALESPKGKTWFHYAIARPGASRLKAGGFLSFEVGAGQEGEVSQLIERTGSYAKPEIFQDLFGIERLVLARKN